MITTNKLLIFFIASLAMAASVHAANAREELKQLTAQLQGNPGDIALRDKIIKLARTIKPTIPAEAERFDGRGEYAFKSAKSEADFLVAAQEFEKASNIAPWVAAYYFNAGTAYEKAQKPAEAKRNFEFYLLASPNAKDARDVRRRISGLEFALEKERSPEIVARNLEGARFSRIVENKVVVAEEGYEIRGKKITKYRIVLRILQPDRVDSSVVRVGVPVISSSTDPFVGLEFESDNGYVRTHGRVSDDGKALVVTSKEKPAYGSTTWTEVFQRK